MTPAAMPAAPAPPGRRPRTGPALAALRSALAALAVAAALAVPQPAAAGELEQQLWDAARAGDAARARELLDAGAEVDAVFRDGATALVYAAQRGHAAVVELLLDRGADPDAGSIINRVTALHFATGHPEVTRLLLAHGADPNVRDLQGIGATPAGWGVLFRCRGCVEALLASGRLAPESIHQARALAVRTHAAELEELLAAAERAAPPVPRWPQFRGPAAAGVADGAGAPAEWDVPAGRGVAWQTPIPGLAHSSPVVWGDRVYVTTAVSSRGDTDFARGGSPMSSAADRSPHSWRLYALDRASGEVVWERTAHQGVPATPRHPKNSYASQTPATDGEHVVAFFGSEGLYCYDAAGELVWRRDLGTIDAGFFFDPGYSWGTASSPILWRDLVIVQVDRQEDSFIAAFDLASGAERWRTARDELPSWATPTVWESAEGAVLLTNGIRGMRGYDPATGEELWHLVTGNSMISGATPVADREVAVIGNGYRPLTPIYAVRAGARGDISLAEGETANRGVAWSTKSGGPYYVTPLIYEDFLYVLSNDGVLTAYLTLTGERVYRVRVGEKAVGFSASPVAADGRIYLASEDGEVYVVRAGHDYRLLGVNPVGELMMATPAVAGGMIVLRTRDRVIAVGAAGAGGAGGARVAGEASGRRAAASGNSPSGGR